MEVNDALELLNADSGFNEWKKTHVDNYFSYALSIVDKGHDAKWQIGFYDRSKDRLTSFIVGKESVAVESDQEVFKEESGTVMPIDMDMAKITLTKALEKAEEVQKASYPLQKPVKIIAVLQRLEEFGNIWNITYVTGSMKTLNIKLNAENGQAIEHKLHTLFETMK